MFTGIIEEMGRVDAIRVTTDGAKLTVEASGVLGGTKKGDSIAVDGTCLTVTSMTARSFDVDMAPETLSKTTLGDLSVGDQVNLERSLTPDARLGGHFVQGHVDSTGTIRGFRRDGDSVRVVIGVSADLMRYLAPKGYVAIDGVSLTVVDVFEGGFSIMLVPYTMRHITLPRKSVGERVNVEVDILAKYVERAIGAAHRGAPSGSPGHENVGSDPVAPRNSLTKSFLEEHGYG